MAQSQERLQAILRSATDAIISADAAGRIVLWNPAAERLLGHRESGILGRPLTEIIPHRFRDDHEAGITGVSGGGEQRIIGSTVEVAAMRADGTEFPVELSLATWTTDAGRFYGAIIRDITQRKRAAAELQEANEALAQKNQQLEALSAKLPEYLSRQLYESIFDGPTDVRVTSYRKQLTIFFSDIRGFTELTDSMEAEPLSRLLNETGLPGHRNSAGFRLRLRLQVPVREAKAPVSPAANRRGWKQGTGLPGRGLEQGTPRWPSSVSTWGRPIRLRRYCGAAGRS